jgi:hypothetical protein
MSHFYMGYAMIDPFWVANGAFVMQQSKSSLCISKQMVVS